MKVLTAQKKPNEDVARAYATVAGIDWKTVTDWYIAGTELVFVTEDKPTQNRGWAA